MVAGCIEDDLEEVYQTISWDKDVKIIKFKKKKRT